MDSAALASRRSDVSRDPYGASCIRGLTAGVVPTAKPPVARETRLKSARPGNAAHLPHPMLACARP
jgi:hypothetical protein